MKKQAVEIRPAVLEDTALLAVFGARTFQAAFAKDNDPDDMEKYLAENFSAEQVGSEIKDPAAVFLLAFQNEWLVGYTKLLGSNSPEGIECPDPVELVRIYVDPDKIGQGVGAVLMKASLEAAQKRGYETIWLGVWEHNQRAIDFYKKWGFREVGSQEFVLGRDIQRDVIMSRSLKGILLETHAD